MDDLSRTFRIDELNAFIAIDDMSFPIVIGGIRLITGVNELETQRLAESMALKLHYFNLPMGGAKAGINSNDIRDLKKFISHDFVKHLLDGDNKYHISFISGPDIGTSETDYREALIAAKLDHLVRPGLLSQPSIKYKLQLDNVVTAFGCIVSINTIFEQLPHLGTLDHCKISIEGFGKVGTGIASILGSRGKIVAVSTKYGSIYNVNGFQVSKLLKAQLKFGDKFIFELETEIFPTEDLFLHKTDIIIPGARTEVITRELAEKIITTAKPKMIVPTANYPYTESGRNHLETNQIICFPDFISSSGAVIAAMTEFAGFGSEDNAMILVEKTIQKEVMKLLDTGSESSNFDIYDRAKKRSQQYKLAIKAEFEEKGPETSISAIARNFIRKYAPEILVQS